jgi:hypothetical protein
LSKLAAGSQQDTGSKTAWGVPEWAALIEAASNSYAQQATPQELALLASSVTDLFDFACVRIHGSQEDPTTDERA